MYIPKCKIMSKDPLKVSLYFFIAYFTFVLNSELFEIQLQKKRILNFSKMYLGNVAVAGVLQGAPQKYEMYLKYGSPPTVAKYDYRAQVDRNIEHRQIRLCSTCRQGYRAQVDKIIEHRQTGLQSTGRQDYRAQLYKIIELRQIRLQSIGRQDYRAQVDKITELRQSRLQSIARQDYSAQVDKIIDQRSARLQS